MKKIFFIISLLFYASLLPLEQVTLNNQNYLTTALMKLEPTHPFIVPKTTFFNTLFQQDNKFFTEIIVPYFLNSWVNYKDYIYTLFVLTPGHNEALLTSLSTIEWMACLVNCVYPNHLIQLLFGENVMLLSSRNAIYHSLVYINEDKLKKITNNQLTKTDLRNLTLTNMAFATLSIITVALTNLNHSDLFSRFTYFSLQQLALNTLINFYFYYDISFKQKFLCSIPLLYLSLIAKGISKETTYFDNFLPDINAIFEAKKVMFFVSILLACTFIKSKNKIFTAPCYWLPIGIAHVLYLKYSYDKKLCNATHINYNTFSERNQRISYFCLKNIIPISAVLAYNLSIYLTNNAADTTNQ